MIPNKTYFSPIFLSKLKTIAELIVNKQNLIFHIILELSIFTLILKIHEIKKNMYIILTVLLV